MASTLKSLRALSAPSRVRLLALLNESELTVRELTEITGMRQSGISMHLGQLQESGLVESSRDGKNSYYRVARDNGADNSKLVNLAAAWALHRSSGESLNVEGAFLHVVADLLGSVAVVAGGILVLAFEWNIADPIFGIVIGVLILASSLRLLWKVVHVLMEGTPSHLDLHHLCQRLEELEGVTGVHDIHAWTITTGYDALSAHVTADPTVMQDPNPVLQALRDIASSEFGIGHVTIQLEDSKDGCVEDHHIEHPAVHDSSHRHDES